MKGYARVLLAECDTPRRNPLSVRYEAAMKVLETILAINVDDRAAALELGSILANPHPASLVSFTIVHNFTSDFQAFHPYGQKHLFSRPH